MWINSVYIKYSEQLFLETTKIYLKENYRYSVFSVTV